MTFNIMALSIMALSINDIQHSDTQHKNGTTTFSIMTLSKSLGCHKKLLANFIK
jgi:hypothetical protein